MMEISVKDITIGESTRYTLPDDKTVFDLKTEVGHSTNHSIESLCLQCDGAELTDDQLRLAECANKEILLSIKEPMTLKIDIPSELVAELNEYSCSVSGNDRIINVKEKLAKVTNIPAGKISLRLNEVDLANDDRLRDANIDGDSVLTLRLAVTVTAIDFPNELEEKIDLFIEGKKTVDEFLNEYCREKSIDRDIVELWHDNRPQPPDTNMADLIIQTSNSNIRLIRLVQVHLIISSTEILELKVSPFENIRDFREKLKVSDEDVLMIDQLIVETHNSLSKYGRKQLYKIYKGFPLKIKTLDINFSTPFYVHFDSEIGTIRHKISKSINTDLTFVNLYLRDEKLVDNMNLQSYEIDRDVSVTLRIGSTILLFVNEELLEFIVKPNKTFDDIKHYIHYKYKTNFSAIKFLIDDKEVDEDADLVSLVKANTDLIINVSNVKPLIDLQVKYDNTIKTFHIEKDAKIEDLKKLISIDRKIDQNKIKLLINQEELKDELLIESYGIDRSTEVTMIYQTNENKVSIIDNDDVYQIEVDPGDCIQNLKRKIAAKKRISVKQIHLLQYQNYLENDKVIDNNEINENSLLTLKIGVRLLVIDQYKCHINVILSKNSSVSHLKDILCIENQINMDRLTLLYEDRELRDEELITGFDLKRNFIIKVVPQSSVVSHEEISIYVCNLTSLFTDIVIVSIRIRRNEPVKKIKEKLLKNQNIDIDSLTISFLGDDLDDSKDFNQCDNIEDNNTVILKNKSNCCFPQVSSSMVINVKQVSNDNTEPRLHKFLLDDYQTIGNLKQRLRDEFNLSVNQITLVFQGKIPEDDTPFRDLDYDDELTFMMITKEPKKTDNAETIRIILKFSLLSKESNYPDEEMEVNKTDSVELIKKQIADKFHLENNSFTISFNDEILVYRNSIDSYQLQDKSEVFICNCVLIKQFTGTSGDTANVRRYPVKLTDRVQDLKFRIAKKLNLQIPFIKLNFQGEYLIEETLLTECNIEDESFIMMISTLPGGFSGAMSIVWTVR